LGLAGLLFGGAWLAVRALPGWAEVWVVHEMREAGLEAEAFPISRIGLTGSRAGSSWLGKGDHRLDWESIEVSYLPHHLLAGRVERLELAGPSLRIRLPLESPFTVAVADGMPPATEERPPSLPPPSAPQVTTTAVRPGVQRDRKASARSSVRARSTANLRGTMR